MLPTPPPDTAMGVASRRVPVVSKRAATMPVLISQATRKTVPSVSTRGGAWTSVPRLTIEITPPVVDQKATVPVRPE
ncbi:MAG: hypothetical protein IPN17_31460 [Deltaproteobacteria bacterium]|jgi:hypothetical protein|nr:hypothetical protein [Deltaproteobacteria bacterium]